MSGTQRIQLAGSHRDPLPGAKYLSPVDTNENVSVTVVLRRKRGAEPSPAEVWNRESFKRREQYGALYGSDPAEAEAIERFAHEHGLTVAHRNEPARSITLIGPAKAMEAAFGVKLGVYEDPKRRLRYRGREGSILLPEAIHSSVIAVLGLDNRPVAKPHMRRRTPAQQAQNISFTPLQVAVLYNFPSGIDGTGETIGIIELGGGYSTSDLQTYFSGLGVQTPNVTAVSVDGGSNQPGSDADGEVMLDIEVAGAVAPAANIVVYFAPNTDQGFVDAISQAVHDTTRKPSVISISWGASEDSWTDQSRTAMNQALQDAAAVGVTVVVACGDNGSTDGATDGKLHVDFPAASPYSLACGGTTLRGSGTQIASETVWNELSNNEGATGGGVSNFFPIPDYQSGAGIPVQPETNFAGRGLPDVAGDADPSTGYSVLVDGQNEVIGGTSAVAPLWAGLLALVNQQVGNPAGFVNPLLYKAAPSGFHDITQGTNGTYQAGPGWDACTGLGSPDGAALLQALQNGSTAS
jgi:kumamolisin